MLTTARVPSDDAAGWVASVVVLAQNPALSLMAAASQLLDSPAGRITNQFFHLCRGLALEQFRVRKDVFYRSDLGTSADSA